MKKVSILVVFATIFISGIAPAQLLYCARWRDTGSKQPIDTCILAVTYEFSYVKDTSDMKYYHDRNILEIGRRVHHFYSLYAAMMDSMHYNHYSAIPRGDVRRLEMGVNTTKWLKSDEIPWYMDIYTSPLKKERLVSTRFDDCEYQYSEYIEPLEWQITPQSDIILGYVCYQATTVFRSRVWQAWFTTDLPYSLGPWKLGGLPGVILRATDKQRLFQWEAIGIVQPSRRLIYEYADKALHNLTRSQEVIPSHKKITCNRKDVDRLWRRQWLAPLTIMFLDGEEHIVYDMSTRKTVKIDVNNIPNGYYPKLELE